MIFLFLNLILLIKSNEIPFHVMPGLFDASQKETMGLEYAPGIKTVTVFSSSDDTNHYNNGVVMTWFKNNLYCMWQTSPQDEDSSDTIVVYSISEDMGETWSPPFNLSTPVDGHFCTSGGWLSNGDTLPYIHNKIVDKLIFLWGDGLLMNFQILKMAIPIIRLNYDF